MSSRMFFATELVTECVLGSVRRHNTASSWQTVMMALRRIKYIRDYVVHFYSPSFRLSLF